MAMFGKIPVLQIFYRSETDREALDQFKRQSIFETVDLRDDRFCWRVEDQHPSFSQLPQIPQNINGDCQNTQSEEQIAPIPLGGRRNDKNRYTYRHGYEPLGSDKRLGLRLWPRAIETMRLGSSG